ncbi:hypothetical protein ACQ4PT_027559 [Festuca glaucescens]
MLQNLTQPRDQKEMLVKPKHDEEEEEDQRRKQNKKHPRKRRMAAEPKSESRSDWHAYQARLARDSWNTEYAAAGHYGSYETITTIPAMRFNDHLYDSAGPRETLQIFSIKVVGIKEGVSWPLYVYGTLAVRDTVDHNRNIIFDRQRDNCQTVPEELYLKMFVCKPLGKESFE